MRCMGNPTGITPYGGVFDRLPYIAEGDVRRGNALPVSFASYIAFGDVWAIDYPLWGKNKVFDRFKASL